MSELVSAIRELLASGVKGAELDSAIRALLPPANSMAGKSYYLRCDTHVYALVDPRTQKPFYIGISCYPDERFYQHHRDPCSAAWRIIQDIEDCGLECAMQIVGTFKNRNDALKREHELICELPGLVNRSRKLTRCWDHEVAA